MEMRTGALFLVLIVSGVCASPHGYGVKGGAAAKAEARAVAGAYGGEIPVALQPGSAFSGSFSKSSASSFASSSASSSASSYSFGGSVPSGFDHKDLSHGGCATGSCHNREEKTAPHYGSAPNSQSGASAGAFAGASAGSINFPKLNGNCGDKGCSKDNASLCSGEECSENIKKCKSGKCNSLDDDSNDIRSNGAKFSETKDNSVPECINGNCGSTIPHHAGSESTNVFSSSTGTTVSAPYSNPPSTYLATPKEPCDSTNCDSSKVSAPSSYNVPLGTISEKPCAYGNCDASGSSTPALSVSNQYYNPGCSAPGCVLKPPTNYLQVPNYSDGSSDCGSSGTCGTSKSDRYDIGPITQTPKTPTSSYASPNTKYPSTPASPSSYSPTGPHIPLAPKMPQMSFVSLPVTDSNPSFIALNGPNVHTYHNQPTPGPHFSSTSYASGQTIPQRPSYAPVSTNIPHFASSYPMGTFSSIPSAIPTGSGYVHAPSGPGCGPSGCGAGPTSYPGSFHTAPSYRPDQLPCKTPGCNMQTFLGAQGPLKPDFDSEKRPQYSGGFGGPPGLLKPNEFTGPSSVPSSNQNPTSEVNLISPRPGYGNTPSVGCAHGNCNTYPGYGQNAGSPVQCQSGNCNINQGQFGSGSSGAHADNGNHIARPGVESNCASGKCNQQHNHNGAAAGSHIPVHGAIGAGPSACGGGNCNQAPNYNGFSSGSINTGYGGVAGGPAECTSGNCIQAPNDNGQATGSNNPTHGAAVVNPAHCTSGNCNHQSNSNVAATGSNIPGHGGIVGNPTQCTSGNCNQAPSSNGGAYGSAAVSAASASAGAYAGGFGGPPGLLKPHDHGKLEGKDAAGKLLSSLRSVDEYSAGLSNNGNAESRGDDYGSETLNGDTRGNNAHEGSKHSGCNSGCEGNGGTAASAKAYAGASSVAGAKGYGGAFAGSSASAHASSGAHTKGGYGGK